MIELRQSEFPTVVGLREWLRGVGHRAEFGGAVLEGINPGRVFVDKRGDPAAALVWSRSGYCFLLGEPSDEFLLRLEPILFTRLDQNVMLVTFAPSTTTRLETTLGHAVSREELLACGWQEALAKHSAPASFPPGTELRPISGALVEELMAFKPFVRRFWGDAPRFAANGFGFCVVAASGEIVSGCHTAWVGGGVHEAGVETAEPWRRRRPAHACTAAFVDESRQRGGRPSWHCSAANHASVALARSVGFVPEGRLDMLVWHRSGPR